MECPFCKEDLKLKQTPRGLYAKCEACRFSGYVPKCKVETMSVRSPSDVVAKSIRSSHEVETMVLPCCQKYKTEGGLKAHLKRVVEEEGEHPGIYRKHRKFLE